MSETGQLFQLVTKKPPEPHLWDKNLVPVPANPKLGRAQQTERKCLKCGLVKITVHPERGEAKVPRLWRWGDDLQQFCYDGQPPCGEAVVLPDAILVGAVG